MVVMYHNRSWPQQKVATDLDAINYSCHLFGLRIAYEWNAGMISCSQLVRFAYQQLPGTMRLGFGKRASGSEGLPFKHRTSQRIRVEQISRSLELNQLGQMTESVNAVMMRSGLSLG